MAFNSLRAVKVLPIFLSFELFFSLNTLQPVYAQSNLGAEETQEKIIQTHVVHFQPPTNEKPNGSMPGSSRDGLKLLVPQHQGKKDILVFGLTTKAKPIFFIDVKKREIQKVKITLFTLIETESHETEQETRKIIYETTTYLRETPGEIGIRLPDDAPELEVGKTYMISFQASGSFVSGFIKRAEIDPTLNSQLESASPLEKAILYAENGIWFDTLEIIDELKRSRPEDLRFANEWEQLVNFVKAQEETAKQ